MAPASKSRVEAGRLRLRVQQQPAGALFDFRNGRARLHRRRRQPLADEVERDDVLCLGENLLDLVGVAIAHRRHDIVGCGRPHHRRAGLDRLQGIDDRRQHLVVHHDRLRRGLRLHARFRHHGGDRLAGVTHHFMRKQPPRRHRHRRAVRALEDVQRREAADIVLDEIGAGVDRGDAGHLCRVSRVDRHNLRMRMRRAQHIEPQRAVLRLVVDELPLPGEQPLVFQTLDGLAGAETQIAGKNVHSLVLRVFLEIGGPVLADFGRGIPPSFCRRLHPRSCDGRLCRASARMTGARWSTASSHKPLIDLAQHGFHHLALLCRQRGLRRHGIADVVALDRKPRLDAGGEVEAREGLVDPPQFSLQQPSPRPSALRGRDRRAQRSAAG